jgi:hypothetical protein
MISDKLPARYFVDANKLILNSTWRGKKNSGYLMQCGKKKSKVGGLI